MRPSTCQRLTPIVALAASILAWAPQLRAQAPDSAQYRSVNPWGGAVRFSVPTAWNVLQESTRDSLGFFVYHVRNPATDSGSERTNVLVLPRAAKVTGDFRKFTDSAFRSVSDNSQVVLDDRMVHKDRRAIFWRGEANGVPYIGFDNYARFGRYWIHVRIAHPLVDGTTGAWSDAFYRDAEALVRSVTIGGRRVMDDDTGFPAPMRIP